MSHVAKLVPCMYLKGVCSYKQVCERPQGLIIIILSLVTGRSILAKVKQYSQGVFTHELYILSSNCLSQRKTIETVAEESWVYFSHEICSLGGFMSRRSRNFHPLYVGRGVAVLQKSQ